MITISHPIGVKTYLLNWLLVLLWIVLQVYFYSKSGIRLSVDSDLYINEAYRLLQGDLPSGHEVWYTGYSSLIALLLSLKLGLKAVVFTQILLSGVAAGCLFAIAKKVTNHPLAAYLATLFYIMWVSIQEWNVFIYTDSLFTSCGIISFLVILKSQKSYHLLLTVPLVLYTFFIRPSGFAFVIGMAAYFFTDTRKNYLMPKKAGYVVLLLAGAAILCLLNVMLKDFTLIESYQKAEVIYPDITLIIKAPQDLVVSSRNHEPLVRLSQFILDNPLYFFKLAGVKLVLFFASVKPYFSTLHNVLIIVFLYPLYLLAFKTIKQAKWTAEKAFMVAFISAEGIMVALTTENWDGRFLSPVLPYIFVLASMSIDNFRALNKVRLVQ